MPEKDLTVKQLLLTFGLVDIDGPLTEVYVIIDQPNNKDARVEFLMTEPQRKVIMDPNNSATTPEMASIKATMNLKVAHWSPRYSKDERTRVGNKEEDLYYLFIMTDGEE